MPAETFNSLQPSGAGKKNVHEAVDEEPIEELKEFFNLRDRSELPPPIPNEYFNTNLVRNQIWNWTTLMLNRLNAWLLRYLINASLLDHDVDRTRLFYVRYATDSFHGKAKLAQLSAGGSSSAVATTTQVGPSEDSDVKLPEKSYKRVLMCLFFVLLLTIRIPWLVAILLGYPSTRLALTCSNQLDTVRQHTYTIDLLAGPTNFSSANPQVGPLNGGPPQPAGWSQCLDEQWHALDRRCGKVFAWNASVGFHANYLLDNVILNEQNGSIQMFAGEVILICHAVWSFLFFCGLAGTIMNELIWYNVMPMLFVFEPTFCAFYVKGKLNHYLGTLRESYRNFWTIHELDEDSTLIRTQYWRQLGARRKNSTPVDRVMRLFTTNSNGPVATGAAPSPSGLAGRSIVQPASLSFGAFASYVPDARSQPWRRLIMVVWPYYFVGSTFVLSMALVLVATLVPLFNSHIHSLNTEVRRFLFNEAPLEWDDPGRVEQACRWAHMNSTADEPPGEAAAAAAQAPPTQQVDNFFRQQLVEYLISILVRLDSPNVGPLGFSPSSSWALDSEQAREMYDRKREYLAEVFEPWRMPHVHEWVPSGASISLTGLLATIYFCVFFTSICDLCFWLFSLRMKLNICRILLKYYVETNGQLPLPAQAVGGQAAVSSHQNHHQHQHHGGECENSIPEGGPDSSSEQHCDPMWAFKLADQILEREALASGKKPGERNTQTEFSLYPVTNDTTPVSFLNLGVRQVVNFTFSSRSARNEMCKHYAKRLIVMDQLCKLRAQMEGSSSSCHASREGELISDNFLTSAYLDFCLFLDQIDGCRGSMNFIMAYSVSNSLNIIFASLMTKYWRSKLGFLGLGVLIYNVTLLGSSIFHSQCTKLISPIYSIIAGSLRSSNKPSRHLGSLWQRALTDLTGQRTKFCFKVYSANISYAAVLQFNLGITSLYILSVDRIKTLQDFL